MPDLIHGAASGLVDPPVVMAPHPAPAPDPAPVQKSTRNGHRGPAAERWSLNDRLSELGYPEDLSRITRIKLWLFPHRCKGSRLIVTFGEHQVMAQLIAKRGIIPPLINKDFPVRHPLLARGNFASVILHHQK